MAVDIHVEDLCVGGTLAYPLQGSRCVVIKQQHTECIGLYLTRSFPWVPRTLFKVAHLLDNEEIREVSFPIKGLIDLLLSSK